MFSRSQPGQLSRCRGEQKGVSPLLRLSGFLFRSVQRVRADSVLVTEQLSRRFWRGDGDEGAQLGNVLFRALSTPPLRYLAPDRDVG